MSKTQVRKTVTDQILQELEAAVEGAKHSLAGAPGDPNWRLSAIAAGAHEATLRQWSEQHNDLTFGEVQEASPASPTRENRN